LQILAAAKINGVDLEVVATSGPQDGQKPEYLSKFGMGKIPAFEGSDGFKLTETNAIARYSEYRLPEAFTAGTFEERGK
jgi:elongation factor 1-gamma